MKENELIDKIQEAKIFFMRNFKKEDLIEFHNAYCNKYNVKRKYDVGDVNYLLYENDNARELVVNDFKDNISIQALLNYCNAEKEYYKYINEKYN